MGDALYVQYGCGHHAPNGWVNYDASPTLLFERAPLVGRWYQKNPVRFPSNVLYGDIVKGLPVARDSCKGVFCSHVLEHLALEDLDKALANTYSYMITGGTFRLVMPDLEQLARDYLVNISATSAVQFMDATGLGRRRRSGGLLGFVRAWLGHSAHLWLWDERAMAAKLAEHGFKHVRRAAFADAEDPVFNQVEQRDRFEGCLAMQCRK